MKARSYLVLFLGASLGAVLAGCGQRTTKAAAEDAPSKQNKTAIGNRGASELRYGMRARPEVFGSYWDSIPAPVTASNRTDGVHQFVATNGWNMSSEVLFTYGLIATKPIRGLPWPSIADREFPAVTSGGVLYVVLDSFHHMANGLAYNPDTNRFAESITGFKPIGAHWYAWAQHEDPITLPKQYEGKPQ